jgi:tetratricopeptide (TPR) repeat protein
MFVIFKTMNKMKYTQIFSGLLFALFFMSACTPKTATVMTPAMEEENEDTISLNHPCATFADLSASDRDNAENNYIFYKDLVKVNKFEQAYDHWRVAYDLAPSSNGRIKYQFDDGVAIFKYFFQQAETEEAKIAFMDSVMTVYDKRIECFGEAPYVAGRKAFDMFYDFNAYSTPEQMIALFKEHVDGKGLKTDYFVVNPFTKLLVDAVKDSTMSIEEGRKYAVLLNKIVEYGLANCKRDCEAWEIVASYAPDRLESLESVDGFYDCAYYMNKYYPLYLENPESCDTIDLVYGRLLRGSCDPEDERLIEVRAAKEALCRIQVADGPLKRGYDAYQSGKYREAVKHFDEFIKNTDDDDKKSKYQMIVAKIYYRDLKDFPTSRRFARDALKINPNWGAPYILIGKLYASSGPICGPGTGWDSQIVTWPAIDKWEQAKAVDPSVRNEANKLISTYEKYMPSIEEIFQRPTINVDDPFFVGCWIQESTTVRAAKK